MSRTFRLLALAFAVALVAAPAARLGAAPVSVRLIEGAAHGFLLLRDGDGRTLAAGDWWQLPRGDRLEIHLRFRFPDDSLSHETFVVSQRRVFTLLSYRLTQRGPTFPRDVEASLEQGGRYTVKHRDRAGGEEKVDRGQVKLPEDVYGLGMFAVLLRNLRRDEGFDAHTVAFTPKPRVVKIEARPEGEETFTLGGERRTARRYVVHIDLGRVVGAAASVVGKKPPDLHYWMAGEPVSSFARFEGPLYPDGPVWRIDFVGPRWKD